MEITSLNMDMKDGEVRVFVTCGTPAEVQYIIDGLIIAKRAMQDLSELAAAILPPPPPDRPSNVSTLHPGATPITGK